jgi:hypothetical protein
MSLARANKTLTKKKGSVTMTFTQKIKALVGKKVAFSNKPRPFGPVFHYTGTVASVKGVNGDLALITFANGSTAYASLGTKVEVL